MKSNLVSATVLALATLAAGASHAEGRDPFAATASSSVASPAVGKTRAEVKAELSAAKRAGFNVNLGRGYTGETAPTAGPLKTRDEVLREQSANIASADKRLDSGRL